MSSNQAPPGPNASAANLDLGPEREQALDARLLGVSADLRVQLVGGGSKLHHVAEHEPPRAR